MNVRRCAAVVAAFAAVTSSGCDRARSTPTRDRLRDVRHVFVIVLENHGFDASFGAHKAPYLADTLTRQGLLLRQYYAIAHNSLPNYIAMISGLAPTRDTQGDCPVYRDFSQTAVAPDGQPIGQGCVYPASVPTLAGQLTNAGFTWKAYMEDMGDDPRREASTCGHPPIGRPDNTAVSTPTDAYMTRHNPFMYFHAIIDAAACDSSVVPLSVLPADLARAASTPNFSFIIPNACHDAHDVPCKNGDAGDIEAADAFLRHWVPMITAAPAFRRNGLLIITFDEANAEDASACCDEAPGPNTPAAGGSGPGGGRVGALVLSPFATAGSVSDVPLNHYALLRTVEDAFHLSYLGYAGSAGVQAFVLR